MIKPVQKEYTKDLFIRVQASLAEQGINIPDVKHLEAMMIGNIVLTQVGNKTIMYLKGDKLCEFTEPQLSSNQLNYTYNDEPCQLKLSNLTMLITRFYKVADLLRSTLLRLRKRFAKG